MLHCTVLVVSQLLCVLCLPAPGGWVLFSVGLSVCLSEWSSLRQMKTKMLHRMWKLWKWQNCFSVMTLLLMLWFTSRKDQNVPRWSLCSLVVFWRLKGHSLRSSMQQMTTSIFGHNSTNGLDLLWVKTKICKLQAQTCLLCLTLKIFWLLCEEQQIVVHHGTPVITSAVQHICERTYILLYRLHNNCIVYAVVCWQ